MKLQSHAYRQFIISIILITYIMRSLIKTIGIINFVKLKSYKSNKFVIAKVCKCKIMFGKATFAQ